MGNLEVSLDVPDTDVTALSGIFGIDATAEGERATALLVGVVRAALSEYLSLVAAERNPTTMRDLRELRLSLLACHLPEGLPSDEQIAQIFQLTRTQARTLVTGTRARYRHELEQMLREAAKAALKNAGAVDQDTVRIEASDSLASYLGEIIRSAQPPTKRADASHRYDLTRSTVEELCEVLGLAIAEVQKLPKKKK